MEIRTAEVRLLDDRAEFVLSNSSWTGASNTMAASLTRTINEKNEIEIGFQRLTHNSSFPELDASKYILFLAYNYRF